MAHTTADRVRKALALIHFDPMFQLTETTRLADDLGLDSLDRVEFIIAVEEEFEVQLPDRVAEAITTIGEAVAAVEARLAVAGPQSKT